MKQFKLALIQMDCVFCDVEANIQRAEEKIREAHSHGAEIICLPEGFNTGYYCYGYTQMKEYAEPIDGKSINKIRNLANELDIYIVAPIMLSVGTGIVENAAVMVDNEGVVMGHYSKTHLVGEEKLHLQKGREYPIFETKFGKFGLIICYDICFPETSRILAMNGADLIICPSAWRDGSYFKDWLNQVSAVRALDNTVYVALINRAGEMPNSPFCGCTQVIDPIGKVMNRCISSEEEILYQDIDMRRVYEERMSNSVLIDINRDDFKKLSEL